MIDIETGSITKNKAVTSSPFNAIGLLAASLRKTHLSEIKYYEQQDYTLDCSSVGDVENRAFVLADSGLIPKPMVGEKTIILSTSSNSGLTEAKLQENLGEKDYLVISNDIAKIDRIKGSTHSRSDASFLPFADRSVNVVYDYLGAVWGEVQRDLSLSFYKTEYVKNIFQEYNRVLKENGIVIIDSSTAHFIDMLLGKDKFIEGFLKEDVVFSGFPIRVYRQIPQIDLNEILSANILASSSLVIS